MRRRTTSSRPTAKNASSEWGQTLGQPDTADLDFVSTSPDGQYVVILDAETNAYLETLKTTGKAVSFTGLTLAIGVVMWAFSPIKFQADMGILLTFMFLWNMIGALWLLPALAHFLLKAEAKTETVRH